MVLLVVSCEFGLILILRIPAAITGTTVVTDTGSGNPRVESENETDIITIETETTSESGNEMTTETRDAETDAGTATER